MNVKKIILEWLPVVPIVIFGFFITDRILPLDKQVASPVLKNIDFESYNAAEDKERWRSRMEEIGPQAVMGEIQSEFSGTDDFRVQHTAVHLAGELLHEKYGIEGLKFCTDAFNYGCFHGFMGTASSAVEDARSILPAIDKVCSNLPVRRMKVNCFHGVGHGVLTNFGYDEKALLSALGECDKFNFNNQSKGRPCDAGIFMEYNARLLLHAPDIFKGDPRPLGNDPYAPCSTLPDKFLKSCYFSLPDWWKGVFQWDFKKIGKLCAKVPGEEEKSLCFRGAGKALGWMPKMIDMAVRSCDLMPKLEYAIYCRSEAAATVYSRTADYDLALKVCDGLVDADKNKCSERLNEISQR